MRKYLNDITEDEKLQHVPVGIKKIEDEHGNDLDYIKPSKILEIAYKINYNSNKSLEIIDITYRITTKYHNYTIKTEYPDIESYDDYDLFETKNLFVDELLKNKNLVVETGLNHYICAIYYGGGSLSWISEERMEELKILYPKSYKEND